MGRSTGLRDLVSVAAALLAVGGGALLFYQPRERTVAAPAGGAAVPAGNDAGFARATRAVREEMPSAAAAEPPSAAVAAQPLSVRPPGAASSRPRSPLERSPGYFPPDDPESMSVVTGRREAPLVDLEFRGGAISPRDLALQLLAALGARDQKGLHALRMTREEFEVIVWPELPESRPITNITAADAWDASQIRSLSSADRAVGSYGGRSLEFLRVEASAVMPYKNFTLHRGITITARDNASGETLAMNFASSFVERRGRFKVVLYRD